MKGLTGSEIVVLLALKKKTMTIEEIEELLRDPAFEPNKATSHWVALLKDKRLIVCELDTHCLTARGEEKAQEFLRIIGPYVPTAIALIQLSPSR